MEGGREGQIIICQRQQVLEKVESKVEFFSGLNGKTLRPAEMGDKEREILEVETNFRDFPDKKLIPRHFDGREILKGIGIERRGIDF